MTNCRRTVSGEGYNPKEEWGGGKESPHDNEARTRGTENAKTLETGPKKEEERTKSRMQNQKEGVVAWASQVREKTRIQERRSKLGSVVRRAADERREKGKPEHERTSIT